MLDRNASWSSVESRSYVESTELRSNREIYDSDSVVSRGRMPEEISVLTFDPARVSAKDLEKWTLFHENARFTDARHSALSLECKQNDISEIAGRRSRRRKSYWNEIDRS